MKIWRWWQAAMVLWMFAFFNVERFHAPLNIASFVYPLAVVAALAVLLIPAAVRFTTPALVGMALAVCAVAKAALGLPALGQQLPLTVMELAAVALTVALAAKLAREHHAIQSSIGLALIEHLEHRCAPFEIGQAQMVQEMRRARRFERPIVALSLAPAEGNSEVSVDELFERVQRENLERYIFASIGRILTEQTESSGIITQRGDHFVALLPESTRTDAEALAQRLASEVGAGLGLRLRVGVAAFPDQEVTLDALVQRAEREMRRYEPSVAAIASEDRSGRAFQSGRSGGEAERALQAVAVKPAEAAGGKVQGAA